MKYPKPKIGDTVYIVPNQNANRGGTPREAVVTAVGRTYFNIGTGKVNMNDWGVFRGKDYSPIENAYPSKDCYEAILRRKALWGKIVNRDGSELLTEPQLEELLKRLS
jgi:hypothetical protein